MFDFLVYEAKYIPKGKLPRILCILYTNIDVGINVSNLNVYCAECFVLRGASYLANNHYIAYTKLSPN